MWIINLIRKIHIIIRSQSLSLIIYLASSHSSFYWQPEGWSNRTSYRLQLKQGVQRLRVTNCLVHKNCKSTHDTQKWKGLFIKAGNILSLCFDLTEQPSIPWRLKVILKEWGTIVFFVCFFICPHSDSALAFLLPALYLTCALNNWLERCLTKKRVIKSQVKSIWLPKDLRK